MPLPSGVGIVLAEDLDLVARADRGLAGDLDEVRRARRRLSDPAFRIRPRDVEIAQHAGDEIMRGDRVLQHQLGHQLRRAVGIDRNGGRIFGHRNFLGHAVDGRCRGEDEGLHPVLDRTLDQGAAVGGVVEIIFERVLDRFRHHDRAGEMHDRLDVVLADDLARKLAVSDVAQDERHIGGNGPAHAGRKVVDHHDLVTRIEQCQSRVTADIAGASRYQNAHQIIPVESLCRRAQNRPRSER